MSILFLRAARLSPVIGVCLLTTAAFAQTAAPAQAPTTSAASPIAPAAQRAIDVPAVIVELPAPAPAIPRPAAKRATSNVQQAPAASSASSAPPRPAPSQAAQPPPLSVLPAGSNLPGTLLIDTEVFAPVTLIPGAEIQSKQGSTLTDALALQPGIAASTFTAGASRPVIRGLDNNRVRVQENGIGVHDVSAVSEDHAVPIDPNAVQQVEVIRGPATLRYGSNAIGGVVSATNGRIPEALPRGGVSAEVKGGVSSVDKGADGAFRVTAGAGNIVLHADGFDRRASDYDTPNGRQANTFVDSEGYAFGGSYVWQDGFVGASVQRFTSLYGIPGTEAVENRVRIDLVQDKVNARAEWRPRALGIEAIRVWFGATDYAHNELAFNFDDAAFEIGSRFTVKEREGRFEAQHLPIRTALGELRGAVGLQIGNRNLTGTSFEGPDSLLDPNETDTLAAFIFEEFQLTKALRLQAAARIARTKQRGVGVDNVDPFFADPVASAKTFDPKSASLGALYELPLGVVARLTGQYTERAPDAAELYSKGPHEATGTFEIGNPNLEIEQAQTVELGFKKATGAFRFDASAYYTKFQGFIFKELPADTFCDGEVGRASCGDPAFDELKLALFKQRSATFYGLDLAAQYDVALIWNGVWGVEGQYDFVEAKFDNGENVPRIAPHRVGGGLFYRDASWLARVNLLHAFEQDKISPGEIITSGYNILNAELSTRLKLPSSSASLVPEMTIGVKGENLLNDDIRNHVSFKKEEVLQPGASVRLFGSIKLN